MRVAFKVWIALLSITPLAGAERVTAPAGVEKRVFDPEKDFVIAYREPWVLWIAREVDPATRNHRAQTIITKVYVQKADEKEGVLRGTFGTTGWHPKGLVLDDGTVCIPVYESTLAWMDPQAAAVEHEKLSLDGNPVDVLAMYPDGIVVQDVGAGKPGDRFRHIWWVPLEKKAAKMDRRIQLTDDVGSLMRVGTQFQRADDKLAWLDTSRLRNEVPKDKRGPAVLQAYDLAKGKSISRLEIPTTVALIGHHLTSFDGMLASCGSHVVDVTTGKVVVKDDGIILAIRDGELFSQSLGHENVIVTRKPLDAAKDAWAPTVVVRGNINYIPGVLLIDGPHIRLWTTDHWALVGKPRP